MLHQVFDDRGLRKASEKLYSSGNLDPAVKNGVDPMIKTNNGKLYEHSVLSAACAISDNELKNLWNNTQFNINPLSDPYWWEGP